MIESTVKNTFTEWGWCSPAGRSVYTQSVWKMRRILKQTINASNLKASLWSITLAPDPGVLSLLQHHWQQHVNNLHSFTQDMALRFGNVCVCQNTQSKGKKWSVREKKKKRKKQINLFGRTTLNSKLDSEKHHSSNIQVHKASDHHRNCKQVRDYTQSAKSLGRKQASQHKSKRPGQGRGWKKRKIINTSQPHTRLLLYSRESNSDLRTSNT